MTYRLSITTVRYTALRNRDSITMIVISNIIVLDGYLPVIYAHACAHRDCGISACSPEVVSMTHMHAGCIASPDLLPA
jgi:hypothetical protein